MATLYDVSKKTGLSTATISRVINGSPLVKEKTRQTVQKAMKELNYQPNQAARMLAGKKTDTIGVVFPDIDNGFYVQVLRGIDDAARESGLHLLTSFYHNASELNDILQALTSRGRTDALVLMNTDLSDQQILSQANAHVPIVLVGHSEESSTSFDVVSIDNIKGAKLAVEHLFDRGINSLLLITGPRKNFDSIQRLEGAKRAFQQAGRDFSAVQIVEGDFTYTGGKAALRTFLDAGQPVPNAIFALNDPMALGALDVMNEKGISVPETVKIVGFDGSEIATHLGITTVQVPMREIGHEASALAIRRIGQKEFSPSSIRIATTLSTRRATT